jgi:hypothetical protein
MQPDISFHPSAENEHHSLGDSVEAIITGWKQAYESSPAPEQCVRALLLLRGEMREFCWCNGVIHRLLSSGEARPATSGEQEVLQKGIQHGWFLVYRFEQGRQPTILHSVGVNVADTSRDRDEQEQKEEGSKSTFCSPLQPSEQPQKKVVPYCLVDKIFLFLAGGASIGGGLMTWFLTGRRGLGMDSMAFLFAAILIGYSLRILQEKEG